MEYRNYLIKIPAISCYTMAAKFKIEFEENCHENSSDSEEIRGHSFGLGTSYSLQIMILQEEGRI